jgi:hypothetical protein
MKSTEEMMKFLFRRRAADLPPKGLSRVFEILLWSMDDNGTEICSVLSKWLESDDRERVDIALAMEEIYPCNSREEMVALFAKLMSRWPDLAPKCQAILETWDKQMGPHAG